MSYSEAKVAGETMEEVKNVKPMADLVFLEWEEAPTTYGKSGLVRPDAHRGMHYTGTVIAVGPDAWDVQVGDRVLFDMFPEDHSISNKWQEDGKRYTFVRERWIHAVIPERLGVN